MKTPEWKVSFLTLVLLSSLTGADDRFEYAPIYYSKSSPDNAVTRLGKQLDNGEIKWAREKHTGYLRPLLKALEVDIDSQTLVFAKTSLQARLISPSRPRALYFNDHVYVGYVAGSQMMEVSIADPRMGAVFFSFDQETQQLKRRVGDCMSCHGSSRTGNQPGHLLRSVYPGFDGQPMFRAGSHLTNHESPYEQRWGGWYVNGRHGSLRHMGNALGEVDEDDDVVLDRNKHANIEKLDDYFDTGRYLSPHSDIVAMMVQDHQVQMHNLLSGANYHTRYALHDQQIIDDALNPGSNNELRESTLRRIASAGEKLLRYMLFTREADQPDEVQGSTPFAKNFSSRGPHDSKGRSLYQLDLKTRLLKHPCSYLIYSDAFDQLPAQMKKYLHRRLWEILSGRDETPEYAGLNPRTNRAILEILLETKNNLPVYWKLEE